MTWPSSRDEGKSGSVSPGFLACQAAKVNCQHQGRHLPDRTTEEAGHVKSWEKTANNAQYSVVLGGRNISACSMTCSKGLVALPGPLLC